MAVREKENELLGMGLPADYDFDGMAKQGRDGCEALLCPSLAAGEIDDEGGISKAGDSTGKPREGISLRAMEAHGLCQSDCFALDDSKRCLGGAIARPEAGASDGEDQSRALSREFFEFADDCVFVVRQEAGPGFGFRPKLLEERNDSGTGGVDLKTLRATVGDGENGEQHKEIVGCQFSVVSFQFSVVGNEGVPG